MKRPLLFASGKAIVELERRLETLSKVRSYDDGTNRESGALAHSFADTEESFVKCLDVLYPQLMKRDASPEEIEDVLFEIGQEFNHIFYHIKVLRYYKDYIFDVEDMKDTGFTEGQ
ncbi:MAG: hypothetical protein ACYSTF_02390 [Planctomycetota bacterium]|jgi:hypothetical protein